MAGVRQTPHKLCAKGTRFESGRGCKAGNLARPTDSPDAICTQRSELTRSKEDNEG